MKITVIGENLLHREVEWPAVPRVGDIVSFDNGDSGETLKCASVTWRADQNGNLLHVEVQLAYNKGTI